MNIQYSFLTIALLYSVTLIGQTTDIVTMGAGYIDQSFYSLSNGEVATANNTNWDIAFSLNAMSATVRINGGMGTALYKVPNVDVSGWADVDTLGLSTWPQLINSELSWSDGAFNTNSEDMNYGWGNYDIITHVVVGDAVFIVKSIDGEWKKLMIEDLDDGVFSFMYANLDSSDEISTSIDRAEYENKNFVYYSLSSHMVTDREPLISDWDLTFTKYITTLSPGVYYSVSGALANNNIEIAEVNDLSNPFTYSDYESHGFLSDMNIIGYDWKSYNMSAFSYELEEERCYFVKNLEGSIYRIVFTDFAGSSSGDITINKELMSGSSVLDNENNTNFFSVYPNPAYNNTTVLIDAQAKQVQLTIYDVRGKKMFEAQMPGGFQETSISTADFKKGLYFVDVTFNGTHSSQKLIIQ